MLALLALAALSEGLLALPREPGEPVRVTCPLARDTRIVLPDRLRQVRSQEAEMAAFGFRVEKTRPEAVLHLRPLRHPATARLEFVGASLQVVFLLETAAEGEEATWRLTTAAPVPSPTPAAAPASPAPAAKQADGPDPSDLLRAQAVRIGRREGLPGQRALVLEDALHGERWIWLRFRLHGGAGARVERVWWDQGDLAGFVQEQDGRDLRLVVPLPRAAVTQKTRVNVQAGAGPAYRFALEPDTLLRFFKELFR